MISKAKRKTTAQTYLIEQFHQIRREHERTLYTDPDDPPEIKRARKLVDDYDNRVTRGQNKRHDKLRAAARVVNEAILFGDDPKDALKKLKAFQKRKF